MIRSILVFHALAKTAHDFIGLPQCKVINFSQDLQTFYQLFFFCEENPQIGKQVKSANLLKISEIALFQYFANVFVSTSQRTNDY